MNYSDEINVHGVEQQLIKSEKPHWYNEEETGCKRCSFCGSIHPKNLIELFEICDRAEFADRKYGYPHKIYIDFKKDGKSKMVKFYTKHLFDQNDKETLNYILLKIKEKTGVNFKSHLEND